MLLYGLQSTYIILDHGINPGKNKVARNDGFKQTTYASWNISSSTNLLFLNSDLGMHNDIEQNNNKKLATKLTVKSTYIGTYAIIL